MSQSGRSHLLPLEPREPPPPQTDSDQIFYDYAVKRMLCETLRGTKELKKAGKEAKGRFGGCLQGFGGLLCRRRSRAGIEDSYIVR